VCVCMCSCMCMYVCVCVCMYVCVCVCACSFIYLSVYLCTCCLLCVCVFASGSWFRRQSYVHLCRVPLCMSLIPLFVSAFHFFFFLERNLVVSGYFPRLLHRGCTRQNREIPPRRGRALLRVRLESEVFWHYSSLSLSLSLCGVYLFHRSTH
jgi:hypothetical protein